MLDMETVKQILYLYYHTSMKDSQIARHVGTSQTSVANIIARYEPEPCDHCGQPIRWSREEQEANDDDKETANS